jgi:hypothetical protein
MTRLRNGGLRFLAIAAGVFSLTLSFGCTGTVTYGYRAYDPYYRDYHVWGPDEVFYYNRWVDEGHRPHRDFRHLRREDQRQFWQWRHTQPERGPGRR